MKRSGKWYRKNEREVMERLGLKPTANSGSGWIEKEDGQNEEVLCQLKSTDASSIRIQLEDLQTLEYNAGVSHKLPVFAVQFIGTGDVYCLVKPEQLQDIAKYLETGKAEGLDLGIEVCDEQPEPQQARKTIRSSASAREELRNEIESKYRKKVRSAL